MIGIIIGVLAVVVGLLATLVIFLEAYKEATLGTTEYARRELEREIE